MADRPFRSATRLSLGEPLPHQLADRPQARLQAPLAELWPQPFLGKAVVLRNISPAFAGLFSSRRKITQVLLTRLPLNFTIFCEIPFDLHVLGTPPAFTLSQDQTLQINWMVTEPFLADRFRPPKFCRGFVNGSTFMAFLIFSKRI